MKGKAALGGHGSYDSDPGGRGRLCTYRRKISPRKESALHVKQTKKLRHYVDCYKWLIGSKNTDAKML